MDSIHLGSSQIDASLHLNVSLAILLALPSSTCRVRRNDLYYPHIVESSGSVAPLDGPPPYGLAMMGAGPLLGDDS